MLAAFTPGDGVGGTADRQKKKKKKKMGDIDVIKS